MTEEDHVVLFIDAARYDAFNRTEFKHLPNEENTLKAHSPATWTIPTFISYFLGFSPVNAENFAFDAGDPCTWIPEQLQNEGYNTHFHTESPWMALHKDMFDKGWSNYDFDMSTYRMDEYSDFTSYESPFLHVFHVLEAHHPAFDGEEETEFKKDAFHNFQAQQDALNYIDEKFGEMLENIPERTMVTVTADHGDAWGEGGSWGHNPNSASVEEGFMLKSMPDSATAIPYARGEVKIDDEKDEKYVDWEYRGRLENEWHSPSA